MWKYLLLINAIIFALIFTAQFSQELAFHSAYGAGSLTNVFVMPSNNMASTTSYYTITFNTATAGIVKSLEITFPAGFNIASPKLIQVQGIGPGSISATGQILKYTVSAPVSIPSPRSVMIMVANIINSALPSNSLSVVTRDNSINSAIIDGPTNSALFNLIQVTNPMIGNSAVTSTKLGTDSVDSLKIKDGQVRTADINNNSITAEKLAGGAVSNLKIADGAVTNKKLGFDSVTADKIAGVSKLIFSTCILDFGPISPQIISRGSCSVGGASESAGDKVVVTLNGGVTTWPEIVVTAGRIIGDNNVDIYVTNLADTTNDPGPQTYGLIVFHE